MAGPPKPPRVTAPPQSSAPLEGQLPAAGLNRTGVDGVGGRGSTATAGRVAGRAAACTEDAVLDPSALPQAKSRPSQAAETRREGTQKFWDRVEQAARDIDAMPLGHAQEAAQAQLVEYIAKRVSDGKVTPVTVPRNAALERALLTPTRCR